MSSRGCGSSSKTKVGQDMRKGCHEKKCVGVEAWELRMQQNDKNKQTNKQKKLSPTVERKELYSISSDNPHEKEHAFLTECIVFMCITESHCCAEELKATLNINTSIKFLEKNKSVHSSPHCLFLSF